MFVAIEKENYSFPSLHTHHSQHLTSGHKTCGVFLTLTNSPKLAVSYNFTPSWHCLPGVSLSFHSFRHQSYKTAPSLQTSIASPVPYPSLSTIGYLLGVPTAHSSALIICWTDSQNSGNCWLLRLAVCSERVQLRNSWLYKMQKIGKWRGRGLVLFRLIFHIFINQELHTVGMFTEASFQRHDWLHHWPVVILPLTPAPSREGGGWSWELKPSMLKLVSLAISPHVGAFQNSPYWHKLSCGEGALYE